MADNNETKKKKRKRRKRRGRSISKTIRRMVLIVALIVFVASGLVHGYYTVGEVRQTMKIFNASQVGMAASQVRKVDGLEEYCRSIMETYRALPDTVREAGYDASAEYRDAFKKYEESETNTALNELLAELSSESLVEYVYVLMYDYDTCTAVYMGDANPSMEEVFRRWNIGECEHVSEEELATFMGTSRPGDVEDEIAAQLVKDAISSEAEIPDYDSVINYEGRTGSMGQELTSGWALLDADGIPYAFMCIDIPMMLAQMTAVILIIIYVIVLLLITLLIVFICRKYINRRIVKPILQISNAAADYAEDKRNGDTSTDHFDKLNIRTRDELEELSHIMADMEVDLSQYEQELMQATADRERIQTELGLAAGIQNSMLPSNAAGSGKEEYDICARMDPAKEVGGDFYDFFLIDDDHLALVIADVSGKGVPAALFMMYSRIMINDFASMGLSPAELLTKANEKICEQNPFDMFVTVWIGILDLNTGVVTAGNAGHEYPVIRQGDGPFELMHDKHSLVLGAMPGVKFSEYTFTLEKDSVLFLYTDGVPEATSAENELYGTGRMLEALNRIGSSKPAAILGGIRQDVDTFVKEAPQFDDVTMLCIHYKGKMQ